VTSLVVIPRITSRKYLMSTLTSDLKSLFRYSSTDKSSQHRDAKPQRSQTQKHPANKTSHPSQARHIRCSSYFRNPASRHRIPRKKLRFRTPKALPTAILQALYIVIANHPYRASKIRTSGTSDSDDPG